MSFVEKVLVPDLGDFDTVDVVEVLVAAGDVVKVDDPLITLESDKATMDVPSERAGKVVDVAVKAGDKVSSGDVILTLEAAEAGAGDEPGKEPQQEEVRQGKKEAEPSPPAPPTPESSPLQEPALGFSKAYASPAVRRFARELGVDLGRVRGSGRKGRILKEDVQAFVKQAMERPAAAGGTALPEMPVIDFSRFGEIERRPLSRIQKVSLANLHRSWLHVPHVTQHDVADITELEAFRKAHQRKAEAEGFKLTPLAFIMKAAVGALKEFPRVNSSLDPGGEHLVFKRYFHLGIAVDTEDGLVVPVIRDVDHKGVFELAGELAEVSGRAREGKLKLDEMRGASFTITSLGGIGGTAFTPIVNAPEVAILGVSRARTEPVWKGEKFVPRLMLPLSLSYDHRVVDGALAVRFTTYLCSLLGDIRRLLL